MKTRLWYFIILMGLAFAACEKDADFRGGPPDHAGKGRDIVILDNNKDCEKDVIDRIAETDLIAGQNINVGTVKVEFKDGEIHVTYKTDPGWIITETHLHIAGELAGIPVNNPGNPMVGHFKYGSDKLFTNEITYIIDKEYISTPDDWDGCYYIAAHAVVKGVNFAEDLDAFALILPETAKIGVDDPTGVKRSYFNVTVSDGGILDGVWPGWCIELGTPIDPKAKDPYLADVFSSYNNSGYDEVFLMKVNWILNQNFVELDGGGEPVYYTKGDVQIAIWMLLLNRNEYDYDALYDTRPPNPFTTIGDYDEDRINKILEKADMVDEFYPECGGVIAIIFKHGAQDLIIEYPVPCEKGEETAWGEGCRFVERGNWAMYFKACP